ncbi:820_t:CDS:1, partial [Cetraspora pellucida]
TVEVKGVQLDNCWVVPHNLYLCKKFNCHINIEICSSIWAVKYLFKYIYKRHDHATIIISNKENLNAGSNKPEIVNEIQQYLDARYVSALKSFWRIMHYKMHNEASDVIKLSIHLPNQHLITFSDNEALDIVLQRANNQQTTLTA